MPNLALVVALLAAAFFYRRLAPSRRSRSHLAAATFGFASGTLMALLSLAHTGTVMVVAARRTAFDYDFRFYSLLLLGAVLIVLAIGVAASSSGLARGEHPAWRHALAANSGLLAVNVPLMPLQGFAIGFTAFAAINVISLVLLRRQKAADSAAA